MCDQRVVARGAIGLLPADEHGDQSTLMERRSCLAQEKREKSFTSSFITVSVSTLFSPLFFESSRRSAVCLHLYRKQSDTNHLGTKDELNEEL